MTFAQKEIRWGIIGCGNVTEIISGPVAKADGRSFNRGGLYETEDTVFVTMELENNLIAQGSWCFVVNPQSQCEPFKITGSEGSIRFSSFHSEPVLVERKGVRQEYLPSNPENIEYNLIKSVVEELQGTGKCPSTGLNGARANRVMDIILHKI